MRKGYSGCQEKMHGFAKKVDYWSEEGGNSICGGLGCDLCE